MKKTTATLIAAALVLPMAAPAAARDNHGYHQTKVVKKVTYKKWAKGQRFDRRYAPSYRVVNYRDYRRLSAPPRGYQWVRSGNDAVMIGLTSGLVSAVVSGLFN